ncbi:peptidylprolyl isomerase [Evansella sp. AB-P1]|uniref:peptidylprolyl isomerase n=1 Tax=Evansella sp. AB-P1 TaxID=3037653 RepID=UPI00241F15CC|nr:peptidylprolyl isomerase [Evansella sp. AB-P1]MDG5788048.1 peptidylprolyl isomerase [Evansella sp. AB-P1]
MKLTLKNVRNTFVLGLLVLMLVSACSNNNSVDETSFGFPELDRSNLGENIVAEYDGGVITGEEFATFLSVQAFLNPEVPINEEGYRVDIIQEFIMEKIISELVEEDDWIHEQMDLLWDQFEVYYGEEVIEDAYNTLDLSEEEIRETLTAMFKIESYFRDQIEEEELTDFYDEVTEELTTATFSHILISTEEMNEAGEMVETRTEEEALEEARALYEQIEAGADINELAVEYSDDQASVESEGRYEDTFIIQLVQEFKEAILQQEIDEIGEPVKTEYGYHIIKVEDIQVIPFEEVRNDLLSELVYERYVNYYFDTLPELIIEINL